MWYTQRQTNGVYRRESAAHETGQAEKRKRAGWRSCAAGRAEATGVRAAGALVVRDHYRRVNASALLSAEHRHHTQRWLPLLVAHACVEE